MKIELTEEEIKVALVDYIASQGFTIDADNAEVDLKNVRGDFGVTATISMQKPVAEAVEPKKVTPIKKEKAKVDVTEEAPEADKKEPAANKPLFS